jgi:hypothetical protein
MLFERMMRAARLDASLYEEVEANRTLTSQAATVVAIVAVCQGLGSAIGAANARGTGAAFTALILGVIGAFIGWVVWSYITYWVGTSMFHGTATPGEMLRTLGFAHTPGVLGIFAFIPLVGGILGLVGAVLTLVAGIVAIRQGLDFTTGKAILTAIIGWVVLLAISLAIAVFTGGVALLGRALF